TASAVPQEPAPSTATRLPLMLSPGRGLHGVALLRRLAVRLGPLARGLRVQRVEVDRLQKQRREAALADHVGDRFTGERIQRVRAEAADQERALLGRVTL